MKTQKLHWSAISDIGRSRQQNEDSVTCIATGPDDAELVIAVSDGVGGANAGEIASALAIAAIARAVATADPDADRSGLLEDAIYQAHEDILTDAAEHPGRDGMACTLSTLWIQGETAHFAHIGDSRIYLHHRGDLTQLSHDHTHPGHRLRTGEITEFEARNHPQRNLLLLAIGSGLPGPRPQLGSTHLAAGDTLLLCSDGLTSGLWDKEISAILSTTTAATLPLVQEKLLRDSLAACGRDNVTLALVHIT